MARTVRDAKLDSRAARARLPASKEPHWRSIEHGAHLGYYKGIRGGAWIARFRPAGGGAYAKSRIGKADDILDADGMSVLTFSQAQEKARDWFAAQQLKDSDQAPAGDPTVAEVCEAYLKWFESHRKGVNQTRSTINLHILPALGRLKARTLGTARIREWHESLANSPRLGRSRKAASTITGRSDDERLRARKVTANRVLGVLKAALNHAFADACLPSDTAWRRVKAFRGVDSARVRYLSEEECRRLMNACDGDFRKLVRGALETGCRYGELIQLKVEDFDPAAGALRVSTSKSGRPRHVPLDRQARTFLETLTSGRKGLELLFRKEDGSAWAASHQQRPLAVACERARIDPPITFHGLRHTWASLRIMRGMPLMVAAQVLGHRDTRMCEMHYGHLAKGYVQEMVEATTIRLDDERTSLVPFASAR